MNGRLYDPLLRRFLNADENIQDPYNTQNYNKYGYVLNNPLMYNDPSGEFAFLAILPVMIVGALKAVVIGGLIYTGMAALTGNASKAGFLKTMLTSAIMGAVSAGVSALNIFGNAFWGVVAKGAAIGAAGGALDAIVNNTSVMQGVLKGAITAAVIAGVSYTVDYFVNRTRVVYDKGITNSQGNISEAEADYNIKKTKLMLFKDTDVEKAYGVKEYKYDANLGENVVAHTKRNFGWRNIKSTISISKAAVLNKFLLAKTMLHETAHAWITFTFGKTTEFDKLTQIDSNSEYEIAVYDTVEHFGIKYSEHVFTNINGLSHTAITYDNPNNLVNMKDWSQYFNKLPVSSQQSINKLIKFLDPLFRRRIDWNSYSLLPRTR